MILYLKRVFFRTLTQNSSRQYFKILLVYPSALEHPSEVYEPLSLVLSHEHLSLTLACQFQFYQAGRNVIIVVNLAPTVALKENLSKNTSKALILC